MLDYHSLTVFIVLVLDLKLSTVNLCGVTVLYVNLNRTVTEVFWCHVINLVTLNA